MHDTKRSRGWANRPLVLETDTRRTIEMWRLLLAIVITAAPFVAWLLCQNAYVQLAYDAATLGERHEALIEEQRRLERERAAAESLDAIEAWALERRGLTVPGAEQIVVVRPAGEPPADWMARDTAR